MTTTNAGLRLNLSDEVVRLNQDLVKQVNAITEGEHAQSECMSSGRPIVVEGLLWCVFVAILCAVTLYVA